VGCERVNPISGGNGTEDGPNGGTVGRPPAAEREGSAHPLHTGGGHSPSSEPYAGGVLHRDCTPLAAAARRPSRPNRWPRLRRYS